MMSKSIGIVVPAYRPNIDLLREYLTEIFERLNPDTLIVELDAPGGKPNELNDLPAQIEAVQYRRGKGAAITAGFEQMETDVRVFADADGSTSVESLEAIIDTVTSGRADLAVGSRRHPEAIVAGHQTFVRRFLGDAFAWIASRLLSVSLYDYQCGAKGITAESWGQIKEYLYEPGFAWDVELIVIACALDCRVSEVPIRWKDKPGSTVSPIGDSITLSRALFSARQRAKQLSGRGSHKAISARQDKPMPLIERNR